MNYQEALRIVLEFVERYNKQDAEVKVAEASDVLNELRQVEPGQWQKVYKDGFDANGNQISIHYFESSSGRVFDVKVKAGWSNK